MPYTFTNIIIPAYIAVLPSILNPYFKIKNTVRSTAPKAKPYLINSLFEIKCQDNYLLLVYIFLKKYIFFLQYFLTFLYSIVSYPCRCFEFSTECEMSLHMIIFLTVENESIHWDNSPINNLPECQIFLLVFLVFFNVVIVSIHNGIRCIQRQNGPTKKNLNYR